ncbi:MAG: agmatine deiminase family protein [Ignavibacteriaceae bacterium]
MIENQITTSSLKYRLPAEWEQHEATWIGWPHNKNDWPGKMMPVHWVYGEIVKRISVGEKVRIVVESIVHKAIALNVLKSIGVNLSSVEFFILPTNRGWMRDTSPAFIKGKSTLALINFKFNAWAKYSDYQKDEKFPLFISKKFGIEKIIPLYNNSHIVLEGGSIDTNGAGTLITTEECLLDQKIQVRNPSFDKACYENVFKKYLGIKKVLWLAKGIAGDDTHGHVDDLCRFVNKNTVVIVQEKKSSDENYLNLKENKERLQSMNLVDGSKLNIVELPMPQPVVFRGQRLPASYANFYISNGSVLVPTFNDPNDKEALGILSELFPDRQVIGIHSVDLVWGLGTIHCLTHEQPSV